jgi:ABC-2 type transport system ATP-binding protein
MEHVCAAARPGTASRAVIELRSVGKIYRSPFGTPVRALDGLTLAIPPGEVFGIAGPNGAGKSTLIGLLLGFLPPSDGTVRIDGRAPRDYIEEHGVSYLSEVVAINPRWRAEHALRRYAILAGIPARELRARVNGAIARLGLEAHRAKKVKALSKGNLQRLGLAQALLCVRRLVILDEPTHGLDPVWTQHFRDVVGELRDADRAILIASHNLDELQRVADRVAIIHQGRLQRVVDLRTAMPAASSTYRLSVVAGAELVGEQFPAATPLGRGEFEVRTDDLAALNRALAALLARGVVISGLVPSRSALEEQFREALGDSAA